MAQENQSLETSSTKPVITPNNSSDIGIIATYQELTRSSPLPPAEEFASYESTHPGAAKEIIEYAKREQAFRHAQGTKALDGEIGYDRRGQVLGFLLVIILIGCALFTEIYTGRTELAIAFILPPLLNAIKDLIFKSISKN